MFLINFSLRRLLRHWRINLLIFSGMVLTGALVASLPAYAQLIAARSLNLSLASEPAFSRNIVLTAGPQISSFNAALQNVLDDALGFLIKERIEVRELEYSAYHSPDGEPDPQIVSDPVRLWSFSNLIQDTVILEGRTPNHVSALTGPTSMFDPQPVEIAISKSVAEYTGWVIGDVLYDPAASTRFDIVGIVEAADTHAEGWFEDLRPFEVEIEFGLNEDIITVPLLMNPRSLAEYFPGSQRSWRLLVDLDQINPVNAARIQSGIEKAQTGFAIYGTSLVSGIPLLLQTYLTHLQTARVTLLLLTAQALIFVFYTLGMITSFMLERSRTEFAAMSSRGAHPSQLISLFTLEGFFLAIPGAAIFGPPLVNLVLSQWVRFTGTQISTRVPPEAWILALAAALVGWISFVMPGISLLGRGVVEHQQIQARPPERNAWQAKNLDIFLLVVSALAYWQLSQSGSFVMRRVGETSLADPLLLIGPSLLLIAVALLFLRFFPWILRLILAYFSHGKGLILPIGLARLARDPVSPSRVVLLISLAAGLMIFSITFRDSLDARQFEMAGYISGADLRVSTKRTKLADIRSFSGINTLSTVYRMRIQGPRNNFITLLAVDPQTFSRVAAYPEGIGGNVTISSLMNILEKDPPSGKAPAIFSRSALPSDIGLENELTLQVVQQSVPVEVRGIIQDFPTLTGDFVLIDLTDLTEPDRWAAVNLAQEEAWISLKPGAYAQFTANLNNRTEILGDAEALKTAFRSNTLAEGGKRAFALNAVILSALSIAGFVIVHYFTAQGRSPEFSVLRAGGLTGLQLLGLIFIEGLIVMVLGLFSGTFVGLGLGLVMRPFLSRVFSLALSGAIVEQIVIDWAEIGRMFGLLTGFYTLALLVSVLALMRMGVHKMLRLSVE